MIGTCPAAGVVVLALEIRSSATDVSSHHRHHDAR